MSTALKREHKSNRPARGGLATFVEAIRQGIWEEMERDPSVFVIYDDSIVPPAFRPKVFGQ